MDQEKSSLLISSASLTLKKSMKIKMFHLLLSLVRVLHQFFPHHIIQRVDPSSPAAPRSTPTTVLCWIGKPGCTVRPHLLCFQVSSAPTWQHGQGSWGTRWLGTATQGWSCQLRDCQKPLECTLRIVIALTHSNCEITANYALSPNPLLYKISVSEVD